VNNGPVADLSLARGTERSQTQLIDEPHAEHLAMHPTLLS
jgi:hypothetical protein